MIRAVFDTNVIAAGLPAEFGTLSILIDRWRTGAFRLVLSEYILDEVEIAWAKRYWQGRLIAGDIEAGLQFLRLRAEIAPITVIVEGVASHTEDDMVLATAISAEAEYLVTGDRELQELQSYGQVKIVSPAAFLAIIDAQSDAPTPAQQP